MFLVLAIYFGTIYYSVKKLIEIANNFDENADYRDFGYEILEYLLNTK